MRYSSMTAPAIATVIGERLKTYRLNANKTQASIAKDAGLTRKKIANAENGQCSLETMIIIMQALDVIDQIDIFLPATQVSPVQLAQLHGNERKRASSPREQQKQAPVNEDNLGW
ncbi:MAG: helix-turn-helix transcriptional regulator [Moritella sp.]|uniref:helix-turn-helix transcriptional regulator n=1 Tax=Moritella sp. TaxID=78556 RepID=UPI001D36C1DC|nr:helix-turn-helix transcriptional regulator [Moritella sp.]NQZ51913.1 helix-turn-helix transcriptional regulator [Moritella sp.]